MRDTTSENPRGSAPRPADLLVAMALLTRLPVPAAPDRGAAAAWAWPLAGALVGAIAGGAGLAALAVGLPAGIAGVVSLACLVILTGALHEDGLADTVDGFWGGWSRERRLEIMKDSRIGTYGVLALCLVTLARWAALAALAAQGSLLGPMVAAAALSRAPMAGIAAALSHARSDGLSHGTGRPAGATAALAALLAVGLAVVTIGWTALAATLAALVAATAVAAIAEAKIGGQTGDVLGAAQQITEIAVLLVMVAGAAGA